MSKEISIKYVKKAKSTYCRSCLNSLMQSIGNNKEMVVSFPEHYNICEKCGGILQCVEFEIKEK